MLAVFARARGSSPTRIALESPVFNGMLLRKPSSTRKFADRSECWNACHKSRRSCERLSTTFDSVSSRGECWQRVHGKRKFFPSISTTFSTKYIFWDNTARPPQNSLKLAVAGYRRPVPYNWLAW